MLATLQSELGRLVRRGWLALRHWGMPGGEYRAERRESRVRQRAAVNDIDRLKLQCFKSAWIMSVLHDGLGVPREMVCVPNDADDGGRGVDVHGEGASSDPAFESVNEIGTFSVSWTLGAILLHVAATIPRAEEEAQGVGRVATTEMLADALTRPLPIQTSHV
ncbi:uncharacterized protein EV422DRAFT_95148 [Fimicolochytrium jonesii]|uniref:uncharacterized protein n=1 Tax=Fimicolochytrium jonesii TaxID=1396493 RepID=UPI0022FE1AB8|nr:uncharacterized protein EV422DRAFT_95148 [Fimicolochytrium jonesii]KAI8820002.1 hypothetical protein EV422DRAFT_95148 [Fimicolochytrium jonesii]